MRDELVEWIQQTGAVVVILPRSNRTVLRDLRQRAVQGAQSGGTDVWVLQAFPSVASVRQNTLLPVVRPARGQLLMTQVNVDRA
jgi:hypothetical protein